MRTVILTLISLALLYFLSIPRPFELREGSISAFADATIAVSYDYSNSHIINSDGQAKTLRDYISCQDNDWIEAYPQELKEAEDAFVDTFNSFSKKATIVTDNSPASYEMSVKLDEFCYGKKGGGVTADSRGWATGSISVRDTTTGETLAIFDFTKITACPAGKESRILSKHRTRGYQLIAGYLARSINSAN